MNSKLLISGLTILISINLSFAIEGVSLSYSIIDNFTITGNNALNFYYLNITPQGHTSSGDYFSGQSEYIGIRKDNALIEYTQGGVKHGELMITLLGKLGLDWYYVPIQHSVPTPSITQDDEYTNVTISGVGEFTAYKMSNPSQSTKINLTINYVTLMCSKSTGKCNLKFDIDAPISLVDRGGLFLFRPENLQKSFKINYLENITTYPLIQVVTDELRDQTSCKINQLTGEEYDCVTTQFNRTVWVNDTDNPIITEYERVKDIPLTTLANYSNLVLINDVLNLDDLVFDWSDIPDKNQFIRVVELDGKKWLGVGTYGYGQGTKYLIDPIVTISNTTSQYVINNSLIKVVIGNASNHEIWAYNSTTDVYDKIAQKLLRMGYGGKHFDEVLCTTKELIANQNDDTVVDIKFIADCTQTGTTMEFNYTYRLEMGKPYFKLTQQVFPNSQYQGFQGQKLEDYNKFTILYVPNVSTTISDGSDAWDNTVDLDKMSANYFLLADEDYNRVLFISFDNNTYTEIGAYGAYDEATGSIYRNVDFRVDGTALNADELVNFTVGVLMDIDTVTNTDGGDVGTTNYNNFETAENEETISRLYDDFEDGIINTTLWSVGTKCFESGGIMNCETSGSGLTAGSRLNLTNGIHWKVQAKFLNNGICENCMFGIINGGSKAVMIFGTAGGVGQCSLNNQTHGSYGDNLTDKHLNSSVHVYDFYLNSTLVSIWEDGVQKCVWTMTNAWDVDGGMDDGLYRFQFVTLPAPTWGNVTLYHTNVTMDALPDTLDIDNSATFWNVTQDASYAETFANLSLKPLDSIGRSNAGVISDTNDQLEVTETWAWGTNIANDFGVTPNYWACFPNGTNYWSVNSYWELPNYYGTAYGNISLSSESPFTYNTTIGFSNSSWQQSAGTINLTHQSVNTTITLASGYELNLTSVDWAMNIAYDGDGTGNISSGSIRIPGTSWHSGQNTTIASAYGDWISQDTTAWVVNASYLHNTTHQGVKYKVNGTNDATDVAWTNVDWTQSTLPQDETVCDECTGTIASISAGGTFTDEWASDAGDWLTLEPVAWQENTTYSHNLSSQRVYGRVNVSNNYTTIDFHNVSYSECPDNFNVSASDSVLLCNTSDTGDWIIEVIHDWLENLSYSHNLSSQEVLRLINGTSTYNFTDVDWVVSMPANETVCDYCTGTIDVNDTFEWNATDTDDWINETIHSWTGNMSYQNNLTHQGIVKLVNGTAYYNFTDASWIVSNYTGEVVCDYCYGTRNINRTFEWNASDTGDWLTETEGTDWQQYVTEITYATGPAWIHGKGRAISSAYFDLVNVEYDNDVASTMCRSDGWSCTIAGSQYIPLILALDTGTDDDRAVIGSQANIITQNTGQDWRQDTSQTTYAGGLTHIEGKANYTNADTLDYINVVNDEDSFTDDLNRTSWTNCSYESGTDDNLTYQASATNVTSNYPILCTKSDMVTKTETLIQNTTALVDVALPFEAKATGTNTDTINYDNVNISFTTIPSDATMDAGNLTSFTVNIAASGTYTVVTNYTMTAINDSIGAVVQGTAEIDVQVPFSREVNWSNTASVTFYNVTGQMSIPTSTDSSELSIVTDSTEITPIEISTSGQYVKWSVAMANNTSKTFNITYNTTAPNITTSTIINSTDWTQYVNLTGPEDIVYTDVKVYTNISESIVIPHLYKKLNGVWTEITMNDTYSVLKEDTNGNDVYDKLTWYEPSLNQSDEFYITGFIGESIVTECKNLKGEWEACLIDTEGDCLKQYERITTRFSGVINWEYECRFYNPNLATMTLEDKFRLDPEADNARYDDDKVKLLEDKHGVYIIINESIEARAYEYHTITFYTTMPQPPVIIFVIIFIIFVILVAYGIYYMLMRRKKE